MTIGIAASGHGAGAAILEALAGIEAIAEGAIGGFVSVAALTRDGRIARAEIQRGGAQALLRAPLPPGLAEAARAVLMSSGPDRPEPLAQFTPAWPAVGLVTGHRFPNAWGVDGTPVSLAALQRLEQDGDPQRAVDETLALNPHADAGLILLSAAGEVGIANARLVRRHGDLGQAVRRTEEHVIAVIHNSIRPHGLLAELTIDLVARKMRRPATDTPTIRVAAGLVVSDAAERSCIAVDGGRATALRIATLFNGDDPWSAGLGPRADVMAGDRLLGHACLDPFLVIRDRRLVSVDGRAVLDLPYCPVG